MTYALSQSDVIQINCKGTEGFAQGPKIGRLAVQRFKCTTFQSTALTSEPPLPNSMKSLKLQERVFHFYTMTVSQNHNGCVFKSLPYFPE